MRKTKLKIKKKSIIVIIILVIITISSIKIIPTIINKTKKEPQKITKENKKLNKLNNVDKKIDYFNEKYTDRYIEYKNKNKNLPDEQVIKDVNMQLDKTKYKDKIPSRNLNTTKILVNKYYYVEENYVPKNLESVSNKYAVNGMKMVKEAKEAFEEMASAAEKENLKIIAMSTYRSYEYQVNLYNKYKAKDGEEQADTYSGRPGHSEHQTGLAADICNGQLDYTNFEKTKEFIWMNKHAHEYGFILRFPEDKVNETGYQYESWHYRYVGKDAAKYIKENNISFEEYYATKIKIH